MQILRFSFKKEQENIAFVIDEQLTILDRLGSNNVIKIHVISHNEWYLLDTKYNRYRIRLNGQQSITYDYGYLSNHAYVKVMLRSKQFKEFLKKVIYKDHETI
jgi:hypothetical protein